MELLITTIEQSKLAEMSVILTEHGIASDFSSETLTIGDFLTSKPIFQYHLLVDAINLETANKLLIESKIFEDELTENIEEVDFSEGNETVESSSSNTYSKGRDIGTLDDFELPASENMINGNEKASQTYLFLGYTASILGGVLSLIVGYQLYYTKSNDTNGNIYLYDNSSRKHGLRMMIIGTITFIIFLIIKFTDF
ncbi:MAG: hypothetical protein RIQ33_2144 [Bacteroidota bacterium]|jgi:hypothetical protein